MHEALAKANFDQDVAALSEAMVRDLRLTIHQKSFPILDVTVGYEKKPIRFSFQCDDWNDKPPSIKILNLDGSRWTGAPSVPSTIFHGGADSFICMTGSREYHGPPGNHTQDVWDNYKGQSGMSIVGILLRLINAWRKAFP